MTAGSVTPNRGTVKQGTALTAITPFMPLYTDGTNGRMGKSLGPADANDTTKNTIVAVSVGTAAAGQPIGYMDTPGDRINVGAILAANGIYITGAAIAGDVCISTELTSGWYLCIIGFAVTTAIIELTLNNSGVAS